MELPLYFGNKKITVHKKNTSFYCFHAKNISVFWCKTFISTQIIAQYFLEFKPNFVMQNSRSMNEALWNFMSPTHEETFHK